MLQEKAGKLAGKIWNALNGTKGMPVKQLKKLLKLTDRDMYLGFGWLLRENKISVEQVDEELFAKLL